MFLKSDMSVLTGRGSLMGDVFDLTGRVALVTGGGSGIGKGCAKILADHGAKVLIIGRREAKLLEVKEEIEAAGGTCGIFAADLSIEENCAAAVQACVEQFGALDILINSAGGRGAHGSLEEEFSTDNYRHTMSVDLDSTIWCIKYAYPECAKGGHGSIINIASLAALRASGPIMYTAAKGAIRSLSKTLAKRLGPQQIRVNTIYPGFIVTEMTQQVKEDPAMTARFTAESPLHVELLHAASNAAENASENAAE